MNDPRGKAIHQTLGNTFWREFGKNWNFLSSNSLEIIITDHQWHTVEDGTLSGPLLFIFTAADAYIEQQAMNKSIWDKLGQAKIIPYSFSIKNKA